MKKSTTKQFVFALLASIGFSLSHAQTVQVAGPVERVSSETKQITVLGQTFYVDTDTQIVGSGKKATRFSPVPVLEVGSFVSAELESALPASRATSIVVAKAQYVPGATPVFVAGAVVNVSTSFGKLQIGNLEIDISNISAEDVSTIRVGNFLEVYGTQPSPGGLLIGQSIFLASAAEFAAESIAGTGTQSIAGTGMQSIAGTGTQSIAGTGKQSISGTGTQSIAGTGTQSIAGTGKQSIAGTGTQSIAGTGTQSIAGTGTQSIAGTGMQSIAGTGTQSIAGTGAL